MTVDLRPFARLLRERSADIVARVLAPSPEGPVRGDTPSAALAFWKMAGPLTVEAVANLMAGGRAPGPDDTGRGAPMMAKAGISVLDALAARSAFCREIGREVAAAGGGTEAALEAVAAADHVIAGAMESFLRHLERTASSERAGLFASLDSFGVVIFRADAESRVLYVNEAGARILGAASAADVLGRPFASFYASPDERARLLAEIRAKGEIQHFRFQLRRLDGQIRWCETNMRAVRGPGGELLGFEGFGRDVHAIVEAEDRQSKLLASLGAMGVVVFRADAESRLLNVNEAGARVLGAASVQELIGRPFAAFYADPAERERLLGMLAGQDEVQRFRFRLRRLDGQLRWCETNIRTVLGPDGESLGYEGFARDVTAQVETEDALRGSEERYRELVENLNDLVFALDATGTFTYLSPACRGLLGYAPEELLGRQFGEFVHPDDRSGLIDDFRLTLAGRIQPAEFRILSKSGEVRWVRTSSRPILADGRVCGLRGTAADITASVETANALRRTEERYRELVENLNDAIYTVDSSGVFTYFSPIVEDITGYRPEEIVGRSFADFIYPDDIPLVSEEFAKGMAGDLAPSQFRIVAKSGQVRWVRTSTRPEIVDGRPVGLRGLLADITALVESEAARERTRQLVDKLPIGAFEMDRNSVMLSMSAGGLAMVRASRPEDVVGHKVTEFYADPAEEPRNKAEIEARGQITGLRLRVRRLDGVVIWVESIVRVVRDAAGEIVGREGFIRDITDLVAAEKALEAERQRLDQVVRSVGAGLCLLDRDLRIVWANELLTRKFGPLEGLVGRRCHEVFAYSNDTCANCPSVKTLQTGGLHVADVTVRSPDGNEAIVRLTATPVRDAEGRVVQILELSEDVTAERAAEAERERTSGMLAGILSSAGEYAIVATDPDGTITYFSDGAERLFGVRQAGPVGRLHIADLWTPEGRPAFAAALAALAKGGCHEEEVELLRAQGVTFTARVSGSARTGASGELAGLTFVIRDVTEERAAQKLVTLLAHAVESSREGMALTDMSGVITYVNPAIATMAGREASGLLGKDVSILYSRETPGEEIRAIARATLAGGWSGEVTAVRADGSTYPAYMTTSLVRDDRGRAVAMVGLWRDVSREKSLQRRLFEQEQRHLAELERQVRERTAELERAYRDLQKLDAMKDRFLTNVSHELRTPLVSGVGYIELILHEGLGPISDDTRKGLRVAHRNLLRLVNLIDDLLTFTRLGSGKESMVMGRFDLAQMVNDCLLDLKVRASKKSLHVEMDVEKGLPPLEADEENVHRVFTNLLSNAEKFTSENAVIRIGARRISDSRVEVRVADNGVGIPSEELSQVFDRFYRSQRTSSPRYGGTGIGLSLVREILEAHGCTVRAESPEGGGTAIIFTLPLAPAGSGPSAPRRQPEPAVPARRTAPAPEASGPRQAAGPSVLVIDDDPDVHELLRSILRDGGGRVTSAPGGREGLEAAAAGDFDLIFLDLTMEGMDGTEVLAHLRRQERSRHTPVYVLTARADDGSLREARAAGAQGLLVKPFSIAEVRQAIGDVMSGGESRRLSGRLPPVT
ncbi:MAG TPA: PAS domain S-box protein [Planctomycetota bacterium]|nr:PAS domain S-box protein [Planctomycetota bacterium]